MPVAERSCTGPCGQGTEACTDGAWSACTVPPATRRCDGPCGAGTQACVDETWSPCEVPRTTFSCVGPCGEGTQACADEHFLECVVPPRTTPCSTLCAEGVKVCADGRESACTAPLPGAPVWVGTARDFRESHPDFELPLQNDNSEPGLVAKTLGDDGKPFYVGGASTRTTSGRTNFDTWFRDTPGTNLSAEVELRFTAGAEDAAVFEYEGSNFFPIDGRLFGNEGWPHNYHFTFEVHADFDYAGDEFFEVEGDDDIWVFVDRRLVIDLGGMHETRTARISLDAERDRLGLQPGRTYPIDLFFAERHTVSSNLSVRMSLASRRWCGLKDPYAE